MELDPARMLRPGANDEAAIAAAAPLAGTRAQSVQRLQVGLSGLAAMVLLVGLANIILASAEQNRAEVVPEAAIAVTPSPAATGSSSNPLAEAGVVPNMPSVELAPAPPAIEPVDPDLLRGNGEQLP